MTIINPEKLSCQCGKCSGYDRIHAHILVTLATVANDAASEGAHLVILSGSRCPVHNKNEGGSETSNHVQLQAIDFTVVKDGKISKELLEEIYDAMCTTKTLGDYGIEIGIYDDRIHLAVRKGRPFKSYDKRDK